MKKVPVTVRRYGSKETKSMSVEAYLEYVQREIANFSRPLLKTNFSKARSNTSLLCLIINKTEEVLIYGIRFKKEISASYKI